MKDFLLGYDELALRVLEHELSGRVNYQWKCANGSVVDVKDMSVTHLKNAIKMLKEYLAEREIVRESYVDANDWYD